MAGLKATIHQLQEVLDDLGSTIKSEHTDYDEHTKDPRWARYGKIYLLRQEMMRAEQGE